MIGAFEATQVEAILAEGYSCRVVGNGGRRIVGLLDGNDTSWKSAITAAIWSDSSFLTLTKSLNFKKGFPECKLQLECSKVE